MPRAPTSWQKANGSAREGGSAVDWADWCMCCLSPGMEVRGPGDLFNQPLGATGL